MTRQEWFNNQTPELQEKFKYNCNTLNDNYAYFEHWVNNDGITRGLSGAFVFAESSEGREFWYELNNQLKTIQGYGE
jgi:hypothetical protein